MCAWIARRSGDGTCVLLWDGGLSDEPVVGLWSGAAWVVSWDHSNYSDPTSWHELPRPYPEGVS